MAPPPVDRSGGGGSSLPTPFLTKTYQLVDDKSVDDIVSWNDDGSAFVVWNPTDFAKDLLPKYFKHNNFSSFVRQLNTYGFRKVVPDRWEFSNDCFKRGEKSLLRDIQRRKVAGAAAAPSTPAMVVQLSPPVVTVSPSESGEEQVFSSSDSPIPARDSAGGTAAGLIGENERLRKENNQLNKELNQMKKLCNNIYSLMSNYATPEKPADSPESAVRPLDLLPMTRFPGEESDSGAAGELRSTAEDIGAKLFGVPIGTKRGRDQCGDVDLQLQQPGGEVKSEPSDLDNGEEDDDDWLNLRKVRNQRCV